ncbi:pyruvate kinase [Neolewinella lacunae]|uniref:Pyruvate kinase n=1 Tax=Neolewinella lacunae TaxID=1517758 RepID=A0A923TA16_9BACT|nr:pyruvate kinase [Neolewinella lacunae]MBC6996114.1 pyruvate kinase [Neolewinella lacunae]MDN3633967.1 pyruvate kinase [Neolewinella lacunae]
MLKTQDHQNTKIVATVGPACSSYEGLKSLIIAGVDVFRLNFSHGEHEVHGQIIQHIVQLNKELDTHVSILADLQGPKLRVGKMEGEGLPVAEGQIITFTNTKCVGNAERIYMSYPEFAQDVTVGERVLVDDGTLVFEVVETNGKDTVKLKTLFGGVLKSNKGVNLPNTKISLPSLTEKDMRDLEYILTQPVNWIALSFVRHPKDLKELRAHIDAAGHPAKIISKIEKPEAIENIDKIIKHSNAIMVARGDLGIEVPMERLPIIQKEIIRKCIQRARPVIVATQMMDSMINNPSPTRAEVTDVANAVLDGTDAVMLSGETSVGRHPALVVKAMNAIIHEAEKIYEIGVKRPKSNEKSGTFISDVVCSAAAWTAQNVGARGIVGMTRSGYTAFKLSSFRPKAKIYIFSDLHPMLNTLNLCWGVRCYHYDNYTSTDQTVKDVTQILKDNGHVVEGDLLVNTGSMPLEMRRRTNMMKITIVD